MPRAEPTPEAQPPSRAGAVARFAAERLAAGRGPVFLLRWLGDRVRQHPGARAHYQALRRAERLAGADALGAGQADLIEALVLADVAPPARTRVIVLSATGALATAAVVLVALSTSQTTGAGEQDPAGALTTRGVDLPAVGLRARCMDTTAAQVLASAEAGPRAPTAALTCPADAALSLAFTNLSGTPMYGFVVGVTDSGALRWLAPFTEDAPAVLIPAGTVDQPLPTAADLGSLPASGRVTMHALFSTAPITGGAVARALRGSSVPLGAVAELPVDDVVQARIELSAERR